MTSRELERLLRHNYHCRFIEIYRRGGRYYDSEIADIPGFMQIYLSWESVCGVSRFDYACSW